MPDDEDKPDKNFKIEGHDLEVAAEIPPGYPFELDPKDQRVLWKGKYVTLEEADKLAEAQDKEEADKHGQIAKLDRLTKNLDKLQADIASQEIDQDNKEEQAEEAETGMDAALDHIKLDKE